jgi:hypothetical protein
MSGTKTKRSSSSRPLNYITSDQHGTYNASALQNSRIKAISSYIFSNLWSRKSTTIGVQQDDTACYSPSNQKVDFAQTEKQRSRLKSHIANKALENSRVSATSKLRSPVQNVKSQVGSRMSSTLTNRFSSKINSPSMKSPSYDNDSEKDEVLEEITVLPRKKKGDSIESKPTKCTSSKPLCCDKCDGKHETDDCPYFKKKRENHPDAKKGSKDKLGGTSLLPGSYLQNAKVVRQPGDGSCLFHSMSYGLHSLNASRLRAEICSFITKNPTLNISDTPLQDWVKWDSGYSTVQEYARHMSHSAWGGGIEMACVSQMKDCNVHVYERSGSGFKRISAFDCPRQPQSKPTVRVLYGGGVHYDALVS